MNIHRASCITLKSCSSLCVQKIPELPLWTWTPGSFICDYEIPVPQYVTMKSPQLHQQPWHPIRSINDHEIPKSQNPKTPKPLSNFCKYYLLIFENNNNLKIWVAKTPNLRLWSIRESKTNPRFKTSPQFCQTLEHSMKTVKTKLK